MCSPRDELLAAVDVVRCARERRVGHEVDGERGDVGRRRAGPANPGGLPIETFDQIRAGVLADRSQFWKDLNAPFYGANRPGSNVSQGLRDSFWLQGMMAGHKAVYDCIKAFSETDFTEDLKKVDVHALILHGDDDQIVPIADSAYLLAKLVKGATLKVIAGAPHAMCSTLKDQINSELLAFFQRARKASP